MLSSWVLPAWFFICTKLILTIQLKDLKRYRNAFEVSDGGDTWTLNSENMNKYIKQSFTNEDFSKEKIEHLLNYWEKNYYFENSKYGFLCDWNFF